MGDANSLPPSKKRVAGREISRDDPDLDADEDVAEQEMGTFKRASDEVLATRKIVKVRRNQASSASASNPFASVRLVPESADSSSKSSDLSTASNPANEEAHPKEADNGTPKAEVAGNDTPKADEIDENKAVSQTPADLVATHEEVEEENERTLGISTKESKELDDIIEESKTGTNLSPAKEICDETKFDSGAEVVEPSPTDKVEEAAGQGPTEIEEGEASGGGDAAGSPAPLNSFQQLSSSQNAFTGLAGTGFSNSSFSFGTLPKDGSFSFGTSIFDLKGSSASPPLFGTGTSTNGGSLLKGFGTLAGDSNKSGGSGTALPTMQEVPVETGEENEKAVFVADASLFEFLDGGWKERGKGELKLNVPREGAGKPRLVMRTKGNYRLILNASLYPDMKMTNMDKKGITFACINSAGEGKSNLTTFALKFKEASIVDTFRRSVTDHKGEKSAVLKTPENSPKASDE
ncbi:nuclear pore complex protein NUP50A-like [Nymphaea colorata]|nr:nuclear pore complex protein NUP50A-like [Nymphaea colorata]XP_031488576.1 nuclear pore complex protein NUP50A-like [Nymphaea colorata]